MRKFLFLKKNTACILMNNFFWSGEKLFLFLPFYLVVGNFAKGMSILNLFLWKIFTGCSQHLFFVYVLTFCKHKILIPLDCNETRTEK